MAPVSVENMSSEEFKLFIDSFDFVLSDCDGVLWHSTGNFPGSGDFFEVLKKMGKKTFYISNNSMRSKPSYERKFENCGINDGLRDLITPTDAIVDYLRSVDLRKKVFCVSNAVSINKLEDNGFQCKQGPEVGDDDFANYYKYGFEDPEIGAVVFDADFKLNWAKLVMASTYLKRPDVHFISGPTDKFIAITKEMNILGIGQFCDIVAEYAGRRPVVLAKPGREFGQFLIKRAGITDPRRVLFIGDMLEQDIGQGKEAGFQTMLVLTTHNGEEMKKEQKYVPDFYTTSLGAILPHISTRL